jgi:hypothetical protein
MLTRNIAAALLVLITVHPAVAQTSSPSDKADALSAAARKGDAATVKKLLDEGVDVNTRYRYGVTVLTYACDHGNLEVVKVLLDHGADVNVKDTFYGFTPLMLAVSPAQKRKPEHIDIARLLIAKGATGKDDALLNAVSEPDVPMAKAILETGGFDPKTLSSALETAQSEKQAELVTLLDQAGAKPFPEVKVDEAQLARYAGTYRNPAGVEVVFAVVDGKLTGGPGGQKLTLAATDEKTFRVVGRQGVTISFQVDQAGGKATALTLNQGGNTTNFARVEGK